jgi:HTH-type transcriptional regulator/antitoxin HipB
MSTIKQLHTVFSKLRKSLDLTLLEVGAYAGVSKNFLNDFGKGKQTLQLDKLLKVMHITGIRIYPFLQGQDTGSVIKQARARLELTQAEAASYCNVSTRFLSSLENNKPSVEVGKVISVIKTLGIRIRITYKDDK